MNPIEQAIEDAKAAAATQRTQVWDKARLGRFTASGLHKLMSAPRNKAELLSEGAKTYVFSKVAEDLTGFEYAPFQGAAMEHGEEYEPAAIAEFMRLANVVVNPCGFIPYKSFAGGSPDGLIGDNALIEVKCPANTANHIEYLAFNSGADLLAAHKDYWWQCQSNMLFTGRQECYFITFSPYVPAPLHIGWIKIEPDLDAQAQLVAKLEIALRMKTEITTFLTAKAMANAVVINNQPSNINP